MAFEGPIFVRTIIEIQEEIICNWRKILIAWLMHSQRQNMAFTTTKLVINATSS
jgi:hypothetical protein